MTNLLEPLDSYEYRSSVSNVDTSEKHLSYLHINKGSESVGNMSAGTHKFMNMGEENRICKNATVWECE